MTPEKCPGCPYWVQSPQGSFCAEVAYGDHGQIGVAQALTGKIPPPNCPILKKDDQLRRKIRIKFSPRTLV